METRIYECPGSSDHVLLKTDNGMIFRLHGSCIQANMDASDEKSKSADIKGAVEFPTQLRDAILGPKKVHLNQLRQSTGCRIVVSDCQNVNTFVVSSNSQSKLDEALTVIRAHIESVIASQPYTHFVCIPTVESAEFCNGVRDYIGRVSNICKLAPDAISNVHRLNIALCALRLLDEEQVSKAAEVMKKSVKLYDWTCGNSVEIIAINAYGVTEEGPKAYVAQFRGSDVTLNLKDLQTALVDDFRNAGVDVIEVPQSLNIQLVKKAWAKGTSWNYASIAEIGADFKLPPAPISSVALCKRYVTKPDQFFFTLSSFKLGPANTEEEEHPEPTDE